MKEVYIDYQIGIYKNIALNCLCHSTKTTQFYNQQMLFQYPSILICYKKQNRGIVL